MPEVGLVKFRVLFSMVLDAFILPRTYIYIFESDFFIKCQSDILWGN